MEKMTERTWAQISQHASSLVMRDMVMVLVWLESAEPPRDATSDVTCKRGELVLRLLRQRRAVRTAARCPRRRTRTCLRSGTRRRRAMPSRRRARR